MEDFNKKDATGKEIVFGKKYGYSNSRNGYSDVRIGIAEEFTKTGLLTIKVSKATVALYNHEAIPDEFMTKTKISVKPSMLFPVK